MDFLTNTILDLIASYLWPFFRISSMLMVMIVFGATTTPMRIRLLLSIAITIAVAPALPAVPNIDLFSINAFLVIAQQIIIGVAMGFISLLLVQTFVLAGQIIGMQTGLGFASMVDPASGQQTPVIGNFFLIMTTMIFLSVDGHLIFIQMLVVSFETLPIATSGIFVGHYQTIAKWGSYIFSAALAMSISAIVSLLLINLSFGIMTRAAPQLNIFAIGFPVTMISGLIILWLTLSAVMHHFVAVWQSAQSLLCRVINLSCQGFL